MIITSPAQISNSFHVLGPKSYHIFLKDGPQPLIFDSGVSWAGKIYVEAIRSILGHRQPSVLFLTHVHWDHCGAAAYLKDAFPSLQIAASTQAIEILKRPRALDLMSQLNEESRLSLSSSSELDLSLISDEGFRSFTVDIELMGNSTMNWGDTKVEVISSPGHTRYHCSYFLPQENILIAGEAGGILLDSGMVTTEFVADYEAYLSSLQALAQLPTQVFCQAHGMILMGREEIKDFFKRSIMETVAFKDRVLDLLSEEEGNLEAVIQRLKKERYDSIPGFKQAEVPYLINLRAQVNHLARQSQL
jgi:glyoxylase-like metal-dependent hydrolase (beta-lactamase superfamily II)